MTDNKPQKETGGIPIPNAYFDLMPDMSDNEARVMIVAFRMLVKQQRFTIGEMSNITRLKHDDVLAGVAEALKRGWLIEVSETSPYAQREFMAKYKPVAFHPTAILAQRVNGLITIVQEGEPKYKAGDKVVLKSGEVCEIFNVIAGDAYGAISLRIDKHSYESPTLLGHWTYGAESNDRGLIWINEWHIQGEQQ